MSLTERIGNWIDSEKRMVEREHKKIQQFVEKAGAKGYSMCHYSHDSSDGWIWDDKDYLKLRLWLNREGFISFRSKKGIYIVWTEDENMKSLNRQQRKILKRIEAKMVGE